MNKLFLLIVLSLFSFANNLDIKLYQTSCKGDLKEVKKLISDGANINYQDKNGATPLMCAIWNKHLDVARYLLNEGADPSIHDKWGNNAYIQLMYLLKHGFLTTSQKLIQQIRKTKELKKVIYTKLEKIDNLQKEEENFYKKIKLLNNQEKKLLNNIKNNLK